MQEAIVPSIDEITRTTELPEQDRQLEEDKGVAYDLAHLRLQPGWRHLENKLNRWYDKYRSPQFPQDMSYEDIGKEYLLSQQMAQMIKEVLDDVRGE